MSRGAFECRFSPAQRQESGKFGAIAIAVPKKLLKSSVARNRIKRLVRESFRVHRAAFSSIQVLVNFKSRNDGRTALAREALRAEINSLLDSAVMKNQDRIG